MGNRLVLKEIDYAALSPQPTAWIHAFRDKPGIALFDSAIRHDELGRWSFLAIDPVHQIRSKAGRTLIDGRLVEAEPFVAIRQLIARFAVEDEPGLPPFATGLGGFFGYDLKRHIENVPEHRRDDLGMPDLAAGLYDLVLAVDHRDQRAMFIANWASGGNPEARIQWAADRIAASRHYQPRDSWSVMAKPDLSREQVQHLVRQTIGYIEAGDIYQANITQRFSAELPANLDRLALYAALRARNPATFAAYLHFGGTAILSSSPERFLRMRDSCVETRPIKGTRARGQDEKSDAELAAQLLASEKDRAENLMIVDLLRNDLSRVCEIGSVKAPVLFGLESYATVHHLVSVVTGRMRADKDAIDLLRAAFPGGSVTGAPKIRAMEIIAEMEPTWRGPYCGAIGYLGANGAMDTNIAIRTFCIEGNRLTFQVGGGIVADSSPEEEYEEALLKAKALIEVLAQGGTVEDRTGHAA
jgi:para-aminobenzoate synthetase component 1